MLPMGEAEEISPLTEMSNAERAPEQQMVKHE
jgi:hypothetical protein